MRLNDPVSKIPLIGKKYQDILSLLNIFTIQDLLYYFPRRYFDSSRIYQIRELDHEDKKAFKATVLKIKSIRTRKRGLTIQTAQVEDESGNIELTWFNQPFLKDTLKPGQEYIFAGKINPKSPRPQVQSPEYEEIKEEQLHIGRITPIYPLTAGISNKWLRGRIHWLIDKFDYIEDIKETLPASILDKYNLTPIKPALKQIHFCTTQEDLQNSRDRFAFEEMLNIQISIQKSREELRKLKGIKIKPDKKILLQLKKSFQYELTKDQETAIQEILTDLEDGRPMNRLLSGDVGSGKTIVAIAAALLTVKAGYQAVVMAPTTVLADQHTDTFKELLKPFNIIVRKVSSSTEKASEAEDLGKTADIIIGTHAVLFQKQKLFKRLGLIIIDEQHRFGVEQREDLRKTFTNLQTRQSPHFLNMTATPIPRTLALTLFGDLEVSRIKNKPKTRKPVLTKIVPEEKRKDALEWLKKEALSGTQIFWIAPLIEENTKLQLKSAKELFRNLETELPGLKIELLHGKMKSADKKKVLENFKNFNKNKVNILVSTSVIEVGIDIPNANIIVIEGAERFGLAQLHQLRGRVGRSDTQAWCFLFASEEAGSGRIQNPRLEYFTQTNNGFKLAEFDLRDRGPGEVYGIRQSGIPNLKIASIFDTDLVKKTREAAIEVIKKNLLK